MQQLIRNNCGDIWMALQPTSSRLLTKFLPEKRFSPSAARDGGGKRLGCPFNECHRPGGKVRNHERGRLFRATRYWDSSNGKNVRLLAVFRVARDLSRRGSIPRRAFSTVLEESCPIGANNCSLPIPPVRRCVLAIWTCRQPLLTR